MDLPNETQQARMNNINERIDKEDLKGVTAETFKRVNPNGNFKKVKQDLMIGVEINKQKERTNRFWKEQNQLSKERRKSENTL